MRILEVCCFSFFTAVAALGSSERCFQVSSTPHFKTIPPERMCVGQTDSNTNLARVRFLWGNKQVALFELADLSHHATPSTQSEIHRMFGASLWQAPALSPFFLRVDGAIDSSGEEKGTVIVGKELGETTLYYRGE